MTVSSIRQQASLTSKATQAPTLIFCSSSFKCCKKGKRTHSFFFEAVGPSTLQCPSTSLIRKILQEEAAGRMQEGWGQGRGKSKEQTKFKERGIEWLIKSQTSIYPTALRHHSLHGWMVCCVVLCSQSPFLGKQLWNIFENCLENLWCTQQFVWICETKAWGQKGDFTELGVTRQICFSRGWREFLTDRTTFGCAENTLQEQKAACTAAFFTTAAMPRAIPFLFVLSTSE